MTEQGPGPSGPAPQPGPAYPAGPYAQPPYAQLWPPAGAPMPPPGYAAQPTHPLLVGWTPTVWWRRVGAFWVDYLLWLAITVAGGVVIAIGASGDQGGQPVVVAVGVALVVLAAAVAVANHGWLQGVTGQSVGKRMAGVWLVSLADGRPVGVGKAMLRTAARVGLVLAGSATVPVHLLSWLWPLWDAKRQTWEDKVIDATVIDRR
jgi:uncharacterized RDD family membrane protein YckC